MKESDKLAFELIEKARIKTKLIMDELQASATPEDRKMGFLDRKLVEDAVMGAVITGAKLTIEEMIARGKLK